MTVAQVYFLRRSPFIRLLVPLIAGIIIQWYCQFQIIAWILTLVLTVIALPCFFFLPLFQRFSKNWIAGMLIVNAITAVGAILTWKNDIRNDSNWFGHHQIAGLVAVVDEALVEKNRSFKANARIKYLIKDSQLVKVKGRFIIYFSKDSMDESIGYGSVIITNAQLQPIRRSGNPGGFDYARYSLFQGITHQLYLEKRDFITLNEKETSFVTLCLIRIREKVISILQKFIKGKEEVGLAEALLIGYKNDLDKSLVQSYSNTGVVHVIAISGLHIGLIYWLLIFITRPMAGNKNLQWLQAVLIMGGLWGFSLLAGAQPSVLRSAVMFTCIIIGNTISRKSSIYNSLAFSAFILLCYNPYWLWDAGFQLSYTAVLSIVIFMKPVYSIFFIRNKYVDMVWKLNAVTIAAQILTGPVSVFHFHQFPNYFILTNMIAVPLSSAIVLGEILLCAVSFLPIAANGIGSLLQLMIRVMNDYIRIIERLPMSIWSGLYINLSQMMLLYFMIAALLASFSTAQKKFRISGLVTSIACCMAFFCFRSISFEKAKKQNKLIIYNIPKLTAIEIYRSRSNTFIGDSAALFDEYVKTFHLRPSRIMHRISGENIWRHKFLNVGNTRIWVIDSIVPARPVTKEVDVLVITKNPRLYLSDLAGKVRLKQVVVDGSASRRRVVYWKKDCDSLGIPFHDTTEKGAFVMNFN